ncbi:MAG: hypothetical protein Q9191_002288 [Dirinaria sp. TL-2023a]
MLLIAAQLPPLVAAELILHVCYSAKLTQNMVRALDVYVRQPIADVVANVDSRGNVNLLSKTWRFGATEITVRLYRRQWDALLSLLAEQELKTTEEAREKVIFDADRDDLLQLEFYKAPVAMRVNAARFKKTGVLVPFGSSLKHFDCSNPLLFDAETSAWLQTASQSPFDGWSLKYILAPSNLRRTAEADMNGLLYFHVRGLLEKFCQRIQSPSASASSFQTHFKLSSLEIAAFAQNIPRDAPFLGFDRIDVGNLGDENNVGIRSTLSLFGPLLKPRELNPHATIITLFLTAIDSAERASPSGGGDEEEAHKTLFREQMQLVFDLAGLTAEQQAWHHHHRGDDDDEENFSPDKYKCLLGRALV